MGTKKSIIIACRKKQEDYINEHLQTIYKKSDKILITPSLKNIVTGDKYWCISGGIAWGNMTSSPFAVVVAVGSSESGYPQFKVLDEAEDKSFDNLLEECIRLRTRYGFWKSPDALPYWYGDCERYTPFISDFHHSLIKRNETETMIAIADPLDFNKPNSTEMYLKRVLSSLQPDQDGHKKIFLGNNCKRLRAQLQNFLAEGADIKLAEDWPGVLALGYVAHSVFAIKPWEAHAETDIFEEEKELWDLWNADDDTDFEYKSTLPWD
jgi:hypothetical protein